MLDPATREVWFAEHGAELSERAGFAIACLGELDVFAPGVGVRIAVEGTGLARGARILAATDRRLDIADAALDYRPTASQASIE